MTCQHKPKEETANDICYVDIPKRYIPTDSDWWSGAMQRRYPEMFKVYLERLSKGDPS